MTQTSVFSNGSFAGAQKDHSALPAQAVFRSSFLGKLLEYSLIRPRDWERLDASIRNEMLALGDEQKLLCQLVQHSLITDYQASRLTAGTTHGLILGNYRVLDRLGAGAMGVVFKAEHVSLPRQVAIKVLPVHPDQDPRMLKRFYNEVWAVGQLQHANIVNAIDAGEMPTPNSASPTLHYFVMEYVPGQDLEIYVQNQGRLAAVEACDVIHQVACALTESHKHQLVHRDIKPSNILVTPESQAKLLDFGLARHFQFGVTEPGTVLGTLDYLAPEQAKDATTVDIRTDIYGLGGTLFWCLTGEPPFESTGNTVQDLIKRAGQSPPSVREIRPEIPQGLDALVQRMMALDPDDRPSEPNEVMRTLLPFLRSDHDGDFSHRTGKSIPSRQTESPETPPGGPSVQRVLVVDDEDDIRRMCSLALQFAGLECDEVADGSLALEAFNTKSYDLVLTDIDMPKMAGPEVLRHLRQKPPIPNLKIVMMSGRASADEMAQMLQDGADDYLSKPLSVVQLKSKVGSALQMKKAQDRADQLNQSLVATNSQLGSNLAERDSDLTQARNAFVQTLAELVTYRDIEHRGHLERVQRFSRCLAEAAADLPQFADLIDGPFISLLGCCAPLHDIGKIGLPDHIISKPGKLDADERLMMQTHTTIGAETLQKVAKKHPFTTDFFKMAIDVVRHHHERYDGKGYPDRLSANHIPLAARIISIADVYDALRSRRPYKPALSHAAAIQVMLEASDGQFDPVLLQAFQHCTSQFERIFREVSD